MRRLKLVLLVILGIALGFVAYQAIMFLRVARLRTQNPSSTSLMLTREQEARSQSKQAVRQQIWMPLERISPSLQRAVLAGEDTNFATHHGFDYAAIQKAWEAAQRDAEKEARKEGDNDPGWFPDTNSFRRGASTISQQLAKNLYLSSQRSFLRKGQEALLTIYLERELDNHETGTDATWFSLCPFNNLEPVYKANVIHPISTAATLVYLRKKGDFLSNIAVRHHHHCKLPYGDFLAAALDGGMLYELRWMQREYGWHGWYGNYPYDDYYESEEHPPNVFDDYGESPQKMLVPHDYLFEDFPEPGKAWTDYTDEQHYEAWIRASTLPLPYDVKVIIQKYLFEYQIDIPSQSSPHDVRLE